MRSYFTAMQGAIRMHGGIVLQFVGDEIEAVFGIPQTEKSHADQALSAALEMRKNLDRFNFQRVQEGKPPFRHGIGICTGTVLAGNTGSDDRLSYALMGNTVNLASRIQNLTKTFKCDILASEETVKETNDFSNIKKMLPQNIKGYSRPVIVYQLLA